MNPGITIGFLIATLIIGIIKRGKTPDIVNYYVSGRSKSSLTVAGSIVATAIGGSATIGLSGVAYSNGAPAVWWLFSGSIGLVILGIFWAGKVRGYAVYTLPEILEKQYQSPLIKIVSSLVIVVAWTGIIAAQIIAAGKIMNIILPGHYRFFIVFCALLFITYTVLGGQNSVISTDLFQSFLIFTGIIAAVTSACIIHGPLKAELLPAGHLDFPFNRKLGHIEILMFFMFVGTSYIAGPDMFSRILSSRDEKSARRSVFLASAGIAVLAIMIVAIGLYSKMLFPGIEPESSFQSLIIRTTPPALQGIVFTALLAAFLSTAATCLLSSGIIFTNDIIDPLIFRNRLNDRHKLLITKFIVIICGAASLIISLFVTEIIKSLLLALTVYTAGIVLPVVLGFYREKLGINHYGAIAGIAAGGSAAVVMKFYGYNQSLIFIFPTVLAVIFLISRVTKN